MSPVTLTWDDTKTLLNVSDGYYSIRAQLGSDSLMTKLVSCNNSTERVMVAFIKNFEFRIHQTVADSADTDQPNIKKALLVINDLNPHFLNQQIDWVLLKEIQDCLNINDCPEIQNCWRTRDHNKLIRQAKKIDAQPPRVREVLDLSHKLNDCICPQISEDAPTFTLPGQPY